MIKLTSQTSICAVFPEKEHYFDLPIREKDYLPFNTNSYGKGYLGITRVIGDTWAQTERLRKFQIKAPRELMDPRFCI